MVVRELTVPSPARTDLGRYRWAAGLAVALALASVGVHAWMLVTMPVSLAAHLVVLAMAAACLWCGIRLIGTPSVHGWVTTAVMGGLMVAVHLVMTGSGSHGHSMSAAMADGSGGPSDAMSVAMVLALVEMAVAVAVIWGLTSRSERAFLAESASHRYRW